MKSPTFEERHAAHIRPEMLALSKRAAPVTLAEWQSLRMNSYEQHIIAPRLDDEAFAHYAEHTIANSLRGDRSIPYAASGDALVGFVAPELLRRWRAACDGDVAHLNAEVAHLNEVALRVSSGMHRAAQSEADKQREWAHRLADERDTLLPHLPPGGVGSVAEQTIRYIERLRRERDELRADVDRAIAERAQILAERIIVDRKAERYYVHWQGTMMSAEASAATLRSVTEERNALDVRVEQLEAALAALRSVL